MTLKAISKSPSFFKPCELRATQPNGYKVFSVYNINELGLTPLEFDKVREKYPDLLTQSDGGETVISSAIYADNIVLIQHIVRIGGPVMLNLGAYADGATPLFNAEHSRLFRIFRQIVDMGA